MTSTRTRRNRGWPSVGRALILAFPLSLVALGAATQEAPVHVVATIAVQGALEEIEPLLATRSGVPVTVEFATTAALVERLTNGATADVAILTEDAVQRLAANGRVRSSQDLVRSAIGIAVPADTPLPAMSSTADFVAFMKSTPSIAYTLRGVSGVHMARLIERLGLTAIVAPKATVVDGFAGTPLREGKVAAAVQQVAELKFAGATNIVPLPDELQVVTVFAVAVLRASARAEAAARVVEVLTSPEAAAAYERGGAAPAFGR